MAAGYLMSVTGVSRAYAQESGAFEFPYDTQTTMRILTIYQCFLLTGACESWLRRGHRGTDKLKTLPANWISLCPTKHRRFFLTYGCLLLGMRFPGPFVPIFWDVRCRTSLSQGFLHLPFASKSGSGDRSNEPIPIDQFTQFGK